MLICMWPLDHRPPFLGLTWALLPLIAALSVELTRRLARVCGRSLATPRYISFIFNIICFVQQVFVNFGMMCHAWLLEFDVTCAEIRPWRMPMPMPMSMPT